MISLLITTPGRSQLLQRSLDRLRALTLPAQLVVVDDGSDEADALSDLAADFGDATGVPTVYTRNPVSNGNCAHPRNLGLAYCDQPIVVFACPECYFISDVLAQLEEANSDSLTMAGTVYYGTGDALPQISDEIPIEPLETSGDGKANAPYVAAVGQRHLIDVGGWDENFAGWGTEDLDLMARLEEIGIWRTWNMEAKVLHQFHGDGGGVEHKATQARANSDIFDRKFFTHGAPFHVCSEECLVARGVKIPRTPDFFERG